jgi:hypothetical protein
MSALLALAVGCAVAPRALALEAGPQEEATALTVSGPLPLAGRLSVPDPAPALFAGPDTAAALGPATAPRGTLVELSSARAHAGYAPSMRRDVGRDVAHTVSGARQAAQAAEAAPEKSPSGPGGGMVLACGLAVVLFMARRKLSQTGL